MDDRGMVNLDAILPLRFGLQKNIFLAFRVVHNNVFQFASQVIKSIFQMPAFEGIPRSRLGAFQAIHLSTDRPQNITGLAGRGEERRRPDRGPLEAYTSASNYRVNFEWWQADLDTSFFPGTF